MSFLYNVIIHFYLLAIHISGHFNKKAKTWIRGRKGLAAILAVSNPDNKPLIWIHCASLGEFEQGRPVIEGLRRDYPDHYILLTFFSPSGYEVRKDYGQVDQVSYLPMDTSKNARLFMDHVRPCLAVFVKYEFWFNYIQEMAGRQIPMVVISANFRRDQLFFRWYGGWFRRKLRLINEIFVQREDSRHLLSSIGYDQVTVSGDTRFDRVSTIVTGTEDIDILKLFKGDSKVLLAGSTWPGDEEIILSACRSLQDKMKLIIVPHEVHKERIRVLTGKLPGPFALYSGAEKSNINDAGILVVDTIGLLSRLYRYGEIAYIGGGFGAGIHNILEAAAYGRPVIFGPNYSKFNEAIELLDAGGAFSVSDPEQLAELIVRFNENEEFYRQAASTAETYVQANRGATDTILAHLKKIINKST